MSDWKLWSWQHIGIGDSAYLDRLHIFRTPLFGAQLHWIRRPDADRDLHNHPRRFIRIVLWGGYTELIDRDKGMLERRHLRPLRPEVMQLHFWHCIEKVKPRTLTLCLVGPLRQQWGFRTANGFVKWQDYHAA
jgi:hypothetical protein